ncbi:MAG: hypothetical protein JXN63_05860 [Candidatus Delongbacteria bacterium]|nr:hypothetical protein [Candidatus Delongbacteria bacterium]
MAKKSRMKKSSKKSNGGFFARIFDIFTALIILVIAGAAVWYFMFYDHDKNVRTGEKIENLKDKKASAASEKEQKFDPSADDAEQNRIDGEYFDGEDEMTTQFEDEFASNFEQNSTDPTASVPGSFASSVNKWASKYEGMKFRLGADPDKDRAADNSHLVCAIWRNSAQENKMKFKGYMDSKEILRNTSRVNKSDIRNGDLVVLNDGMFGMITDFSSAENFNVIYASESKNKVVKSDNQALNNYWLKSDNFKGFFRIKKDILN